MSRLAILFGLLAVATGCEKQASPGISADQAAAYRSKFLLEIDPPATKTVAETRDSLKGREAEEVSVVGQIGGMPNPYGDEVQPSFPWVEGQAVFFLVDPTTAAQFEGHQHEKGEECAFCLGKARDLVDTVAMVELKGDDGTIPARADTLLGLEEGDTVVVTGAVRDDLGMLVIDGRGVYVSPSDKSNDAEPAVVEDSSEAKVP